MRVIRCYLDAERSLCEQFEHHLVQRFLPRLIDIHFEQELLIDSSRLYTFLISLPDMQQGIETHYMRRMFLSSLPIQIPSVIDLEHVEGDEPIGESSIERVQEWLRMGRGRRQFTRQLWQQIDRHIGYDVPLINGNMREE